MHRMRSCNWPMKRVLLCLVQGRISDESDEPLPCSMSLHSMHPFIFHNAAPTFFFTTSDGGSVGFGGGGTPQANGGGSASCCSGTPATRSAGEGAGP